MFAKIAKEFNKKVYSCSHSLKFAKKIKVEFRNPGEIWKKAPKGVKIYNPAFELVESKYIDGIISELGTIKFLNFKGAKK